LAASAAARGSGCRGCRPAWRRRFSRRWRGGPRSGGELREAIGLAAQDETAIGKAGLAVCLAEEDGEPAVAHVLPLTGSELRTRLQPAAVAAVFIGVAAGEGRFPRLRRPLRGLRRPVKPKAPPALAGLCGPFRRAARDSPSRNHAACRCRHKPAAVEPHSPREIALPAL
jgi:hypothetical protein